MRTSLPQDFDFYKEHLERVSRSFAFCIAELKDDFKNKVAFAYLMFRWLDTIEDAEWPSHTTLQRETFDSFEALLKERKNETSVLNHLKQNFQSAKISDSEKLLIDDSEKLWASFSHFDSDYRSILTKYLQLMLIGMRDFACERHHKIRSEAELNLYCYFVAGSIGEFLTELLQPFTTVTDEFLEESIHFGLFLQKINILKDCREDSLENRHFLSDPGSTAASLRKHVEKSYAYLQRLSKIEERQDFYIFSAWSFFLGLASWPHIEKSIQEASPFKISRIETWLLLNNIKSKITHGESLEKIYFQLREKLPTSQLLKLGEKRDFVKLHPNPKLSRYQNFTFS